MKFVQRAFEVVRERASAVLAGSALWWVIEHLADRAISFVLHAVGMGAL